MPDPNDDTSRRSVRNLSRPFRGPGERGGNAAPEPRGVGRPSAAPFAAPKTGSPEGGSTRPSPPPDSPPRGTDAGATTYEDLPPIESFESAEPATEGGAEDPTAGSVAVPVGEHADAAHPADVGSPDLPLLYMPTPSGTPTAADDNAPVQTHEGEPGLPQREEELEPNATSEYETATSVVDPPVEDDPRAARRYSPSAASWPEDVWSDAAVHAAGRAGEGGEPDHTPGAAARMSTAGAQPSHPLADTLEALARRIRSGELPVAGYQAGMGDAAALTAVLSAVMGLRK